MATKGELKQKYRGRIATIAFALGIEDTMGKKTKVIYQEVLTKIKALTTHTTDDYEDIDIVRESRTPWFKAKKEDKHRAKKIAKRQEKKQANKKKEITQIINHPTWEEKEYENRLLSRKKERTSKVFDKPDQINADFVSDDSHLGIQNLNNMITDLKAENKDLKGQVKEFFDLSVSLKEDLKYEKSEAKKRWDEFVPGSMK